MSAVAAGVFEAAWTVCPAEYHGVGVAEVEGVVWVHASAAARAWGAGDEGGEEALAFGAVRVAVHNDGHGVGLPSWDDAWYARTSTTRYDRSAVVVLPSVYHARGVSR